MRVVWTLRALSELEAIQDYVAQDSPFAAHRLVQRIYSRAEALLSQNPKIGRAGLIEGTRELVVSGTPYIVAYRVHTERVEVLFVMHGARQWPDE